MSSTPDIRRMLESPMFFFENIVVQSPDGPRRFADIMAPHQREWLESLAPSLLGVARGEKPPMGRFFFDAVKGSGKDFILALGVLWLAAFASRPLSMQVGAADADQADELRKSAKLTLWLNEWLSQRVEIQSWRILCEATQCEAEIIAADVAGSHGSRPDVLILNELHAITKWEFAQNLLDNASKVPNGIVVIATNAGFTESEAFKLREIARTSDRWRFHQFGGPVPWMDAAELAEAERRNPPARYARLFKGVWTTGSGDALRPDDIAAAFEGKVQPIGQAEMGWVFVGGLDLSVSRDFSALVIVGKHTETGRHRVCRCNLWRPPAGGKIDQEAVEAAIIEADKAYKLAAVAADPFQAEYLISRAKKLRVKIEARPQSGQRLVEQCMVLIEQFTSQNIDVPEQFKALRYDLEHLRAEERSYGMRLASDRTAATGHGDLASALSIALAVAKTAQPRRIFAAGIAGLGDDLPADNSPAGQQTEPEPESEREPDPPPGSWAWGSQGRGSLRDAMRQARSHLG